MSWLRCQRLVSRTGPARDSGISFADSGRPSPTPWQPRDAPPTHLRGILGALRENLRSGRPCGHRIWITAAVAPSRCFISWRSGTGASTARGRGRKLPNLEPPASRAVRHFERRFSVYDGRRLPLPNDSIDFLFSEEVLEHVHPTMVEDYYAEEARVLKPGAAALPPECRTAGGCPMNRTPAPGCCIIYRAS